VRTDPFSLPLSLGPFVGGFSERAMMWIMALALWRWCSCVVLVLLSTLTLVEGQESQWQSLAGEASAMSQKLKPEQMDYNLEVGPVLMNVGVGLANGYNSNVNLKESGAIGSAYTAPTATINLSWPISDLNTLTFGVTGGYAYYWNVAESQSPGGVTLAPTSALKGKFFAGDFRISPYEQFSIQQDPTQAGELSNVSRFSIFQNSVGTNVDWDLGDFIVTGGFDYFNLFAFQSQFQYLQRATMTPSLSVSYYLTRTFAVGLEGVAALTTYDSKASTPQTLSNGTILYGQNNNNIYQVGPFLNARLSEYITASGRVGYVWGQFTGNQTPDSAAGGNPSTFYLNAALDHRFNEFMNYTLSASRSTQISASLGQNYVEVWLFNFRPSWKIIDQMTISTPFFVELGKQSGSINAETYQRYGPALNLGYKLTEKLASSLNFSYLIKDSNLPSYSYDQWTAVLNLNYDF